MSEKETETGIASSEGVVVFCEGDDVDKVVEGTKNLIIHGSVKKVPEGDWKHGSLFPGRGSIEEVIIEEGVEMIARYAFLRCKNLKRISFPTSLETIGSWAFENCSSLTEVDLSHTNIISIGECSFKKCENLKIISFPPSLEEIGGDSFSLCPSLIEVDLSHTNLTSIARGAFIRCENLKSISFPTSLEKIDDYAFYNCSSLTEVDLSHTNLKSIGNYAFNGCKKLKRIIFPTSLEKIGKEAFNECSKLKIEKVYKQMYETSKQKHGEDHDDTRGLKRQLIEYQKKHGRYLNEDTQRNLENLQGFIKSRDNINNIAKQVLPNNYMKKHPSIIPQETLRQTKNNLADIMEDAEAVKSKFEELLREVAEKSCLSPDLCATFNGEPVMLTKDKPYTQLTMATLKSEERCKEKVRNEYGGDVSCLIDIVRASFVVENESQLIGVADTLKEFHEEGKIEMVRLKNRFSEPLWNGYRDALYNIKVNDVICEVQLHLEAVVLHKKESHHYYEHFRSYFAGNVDACKDLIKMLETRIDKEEEDMFDMLQGLLKSEDNKVLEDMRDLFQKMGDFYLQKQFCCRLVDIDPEDLNHKIDLADALWKERDYDEARDLYDEAYKEAKEKHGADHEVTLRATRSLSPKI